MGEQGMNRIVCREDKLCDGSKLTERICQDRKKSCKVSLVCRGELRSRGMSWICTRWGFILRVIFTFIPSKPEKNNQNKQLNNWKICSFPAWINTSSKYFFEQLFNVRFCVSKAGCSATGKGQASDFSENTELYFPIIWSNARLVNMIMKKPYSSGALAARVEDCCN